MSTAFFSSLPLATINDTISTQYYKDYWISAPKSFWQADQELEDAIAGGCGPGGAGDMLVPDTLWGLNVKAACKVHDWTFAVWNDVVGFNLANDLFKDNLMRIIAQHGGYKWLQFLRRRRAIKYYKAVHHLGWSLYLDSHERLL